MILMALDHVRDYFHRSQINPTDVEHTTTLLFLTRWVTHFCAPVFVFLAGAGAYLQGRRAGSKTTLSTSLALRGLWLVLLEITWVKWSWAFNFSYQFVALQVIWAIGISLICLAGLIWLPRGVIFTFALLQILFHNAFDGFRLTNSEHGFGVWSILHGGQFIPFGPQSGIMPLYPLIPWVGVMAAGYCFGHLLEQPHVLRQKALWGVGIGLVVGFLTLRLTNLYGDLAKWVSSLPLERSWMSFLNCTKYPPSLLYLLMTLGPAICLLAWMSAVPRRAPAVLVTFGRVPLFYYLAHIPLIHALSGFSESLFGTSETAAFIWTHPPFRGAPEGFGFPLGVVYAAWLITVALLYPACSWFSGLKQRHRGRGWTHFL